METLERQVSDKISEKIRDILASNIAAYRKDRKMTRAELAEKVGVSEAAIGQYERADRSPSIEVTYKLAMALRVNVDLLICGDNAAREEDLDFLINLGLTFKEMPDGKINVYSYSNAILSYDTNSNIFERIFEEKKQTFRFKKNPDVIARFENFQELHFCLLPLKRIFFNALGVRYYANKYFIELMTKEEIEMPELILLDKNAVGDLPPVKVSKSKLSETFS